MDRKLFWSFSQKIHVYSWFTLDKMQASDWLVDRTLCQGLDVFRAFPDMYINRFLILNARCSKFQIHFCRSKESGQTSHEDRKLRSLVPAGAPKVAISLTPFIFIDYSLSQKVRRRTQLQTFSGQSRKVIFAELFAPGCINISDSYPITKTYWLSGFGNS